MLSSLFDRWRPRTPGSADAGGLGRQYSNGLTGVREAARTVAENVVYSHDPAFEPAYQYFSIPHSCWGGGDTLSEARSSCRSELALLLPPVQWHGSASVIVEHLETAVGGMWLRTRLGDEHGVRMADGRRFVEVLLQRGHATTGFRRHLDAANATSGSPCVVLVEPADTLGFVTDQMTETEPLWMVFATRDHTVGWAGIYGPEADGVDGVLHSIDGVRHRDMPIGAVVETYINSSVRRLRLLMQPRMSGLADGR